MGKPSMTIALDIDETIVMTKQSVNTASTIMNIPFLQALQTFIIRNSVDFDITLVFITGRDPEANQPVFLRAHSVVAAACRIINSDHFPIKALPKIHYAEFSQGSKYTALLELHGSKDAVILFDDQPFYWIENQPNLHFRLVQMEKVTGLPTTDFERLCIWLEILCAGKIGCAMSERNVAAQATRMTPREKAYLLTPTNSSQQGFFRPAPNVQLYGTTDDTPVVSLPPKPAKEKYFCPGSGCVIQ